MLPTEYDGDIPSGGSDPPFLDRIPPRSSYRIF